MAEAIRPAPINVIFIGMLSVWFEITAWVVAIEENHHDLINQSG
jgi:hypothetical protein